MNSDNLPMVSSKGFFSKFIIKIKSFFGKKQYESSFDKVEFFNIYEDIKNGDVSIEELDDEIVEGLLKIAREEKKIKQAQLSNLKEELVKAKSKLLEIEALI